MALATSFRAPDIPRRITAIEQALGRITKADRLPLLVFRVPKLERIAWRKGRRIALKAERAVTRRFCAMAGSFLRGDDVLAHDLGSDVFVVAMSSRRRTQTLPSPSDCRLVLQRVAGAMAAADAGVESGWCLLPVGAVGSCLATEIVAALERGRNERERYDFFATVGHELRTPVTSIRGYLETVLEADCDASTLRRFLETARREALRLGRLVDGMFEFSLLDIGAERTSYTGCDIPLAIRAAQESVAPMASGRSVSIELLHSAAGAVAMSSDDCVQMLVNIVDNAIRHGREGGRVTISSLAEAGCMRIFIDDDGTGIGEAERVAIFSFGRRGARAQSKGGGIGLCLARRLVERAGGDILVGDSPLGGARFELLLPLQAESASVTS